MQRHVASAPPREIFWFMPFKCFTLRVLTCISDARIMTAPMEMGSDLSQKSTILPKNRA